MGETNICSSSKLQMLSFPEKTTGGIKKKKKKKMHSCISVHVLLQFQFFQCDIITHSLLNQYLLYHKTNRVEMFLYFLSNTLSISAIQAYNTVPFYKFNPSNKFKLEIWLMIHYDLC